MEDRNTLGHFEPGNKIRMRYKTSEELQTGIDAYFDQCKTEKLIPSYSGLAGHLGITRKALYEYGQRDEFYEVVQVAKTKIESDYEQRLISGKGGSTVGLIFALKNFGWSDKTELQLDSRNVSLTGFKLIAPDGGQD